MHRLPAATLPLGLVVLAACPVEQTYADLIKEHGNTYASETATPTSGASANDASTGDPSAPTSTSGGSMSASVGDSSGETAELTDGATSPGESSSSTTEPWVDQPPEIGDLLAPDAVLAAGFIELSVECSDDVGVAEVRFLVDGELLAAVTEAPFAANWLVKSQDQIGDHTLAAECEDTAGQVASIGEEISVALPAPGSVAWSKVHAAFEGNAEAADAAAAPDGSWWVCGYTDNLSGGTAVWVAHYSPAGKQLFSKTISRGKDQTGKCSGIDVASDDGHRAVLTGGYGPTGLWPSLWTALVDETEVQPVLAESNEALTAYWGNDVLVNKYGQFEVAGQRIVNGDDLDMAHQVYNYTPGEKELTAAAGLTYGFKSSPEFASAIIENPDGTVTLVGTNTWDTRPTAAAVKLDAQHQVVTEDGWPFTISVEMAQGAGALDGAIDGLGNLRMTGWWRESPNHDSKILTLTVDPLGNVLGGLVTEQPPMTSDSSGMGIAVLSDGTAVRVASVTTAGPENLDMWLYRGQGSGVILFQGAYGLRDEPRRVRANAFEQTLVVGFETVAVLQDGMPVAVRRAWLRAFD
jgi:hypothetical protein